MVGNYGSCGLKHLKTPRLGKILWSRMNNRFGDPVYLLLYLSRLQKKTIALATSPEAYLQEHFGSSFKNKEPSGTSWLLPGMNPSSSDLTFVFFSIYNQDICLSALGL